MVTLMWPVLVFASAGWDWRHDRHGPVGENIAFQAICHSCLVLESSNYLIKATSECQQLFPFPKGGRGLTSVIQAPELGVCLQVSPCDLNVFVI